MIRNSHQGWGWPARAFHWIVALLVLGLFGHGLWLEEYHGETSQYQVWLHSAVGISLLAIAATAFVWWLVNRIPDEPAATTAWQAQAAHLAHWGLYALIFAVTLTGWALTGTLKEPVGIDLFGLVSVPQLLGSGSGQHEFFEEAHEVLANVLIALVAVHVAAALYHHFVLRDGVLLRMLGRTPRRET